MAIALLVVALAFVAYSFVVGRTFTTRLVALAGKTSRRRMVLAWAGGIYATYALSSQIGLILLDRVEAMFVMPPELRAAALTLGLPGAIDVRTLAFLGGSMAIGAIIGCLLLLVRRWRGKPPVGLRFRSVAAMRNRDEWWTAAILALSAGISEELFFRLFLPMLVAIVFGNGVAGLAVGLVAFVMMHRHQGRAGMIAVTVIGAALTALYLFSGRLWVAMLVHVLIDVNALIVRPAITGPATGD